HHPLAIKRDRQWQLQLSYQLNRDICKLRVHFDDASTDFEVDTSLCKLLNEAYGRRLAEQRDMSIRQRDNGPILGNDTINEVETAGHAAKLCKDSPSHNDDQHSTFASVRNRFANRCVEQIISCNRSVKDGRDNSKAH